LPPSESISIWTQAVARRLVPENAVLVWARDEEATQRVVHDQGIEYRLLRGRGDYRALKTLERLPRRPSRPVFASPLYYPAYHAALLRDVRRTRPDVVHVHNFSQLVPLVRTAHRGGGIVLHMHCEWLNQFDRDLIGRRLRRADLILGDSDYVTGRIRRAFPELGSRCHRVYEGVDVDAFVPAPAREPGGAGRLLSVGRISPEKGTHVLLEAFATLLREGRDVELDVLGEEGLPPPEMLVDLDEHPRVGSFRRFYERRGCLDELKRQLEAEVLARIRFHGFVPHADTPPLHRAADVVVLPSIWAEPFGMPAAEAIAAGVPVVATRVGGLQEVVEDGQTGFLVEPGDSAATAQAVGGLLDDVELRRRLGSAGRERAVDRFSWDVIAAEVRTLYAGLR
jgi:spore coat protein SA